MEINKEELEKYVEAIKTVIDNSLYNDLSKCEDSIIKNIPNKYYGDNAKSNPSAY